MFKALFDRLSAHFPDAPTTQDFVERAGCIHESHQVITEDGYILGCSRIRSSPTVRPVCLLLHGFMSCSDFFVCQVPNEGLGEKGALSSISLPFFLTAKGYDVWLLNNRGARYSLDHVVHALDTEEYWDFSWSDMARYDLPAAVMYILKYTGQRDLMLSAFSQGTAQLIAALSMRPELALRVRTILLFSPVLKPRMKHHKLLHWVLRSRISDLILGRKDLLRPVELTRKLMPQKWFSWLCYTIAGSIFGWRMDHIGGAVRDRMYQSIASTTSVKVLKHWLQISASGTFADFDHTDPIEWLPSSPPVVAITGSDDHLADSSDLITFLEHTDFTLHSIPGYEHIETIWGKDDANMNLD